MEHTNPNLVIIDGRGKQGIDIYMKYLEMYKSGYDLTLDEACNFLDCSYSHILRVFHNMQHIRINTAARNIVYKYGKQENIDSEILSAFSKRVLLKRTDFFNLIKMNMIIEQQYMVLELDMLSSNVLDSVNANLQIYNSRKNVKQPKRDTNSLISFVLNNLFSKSESVKYNLPADYTFPERFYSLKTLREQHGYRSDIQVYRLIEKFGAKKYIFNNFVRYDINDLNKPEDKIIKADYKSYLLLSTKENAIKKIEDYLLRYSSNLAKGNLL